MNDQDLISVIQQNSGFDDRAEVERAAYATLTVLGLLLAAGQPVRLRNQLPPSFDKSLTTTDKGERFSLDVFYDLVGQFEGSTDDDARRHAQAVMAGVRTAIEPREWDAMLDQLPGDYADLMLPEPVH